MESGTNNGQGGGQKNVLLQTLEGILSGNEEIKEQMDSYSRTQEQLLYRLSEKEARLSRESFNLETLSRDIASEIERKNQENIITLQEVFDVGLEKIRKVELGLGEKDRGLLDRIDGVFHKYWLLPVAISAVSLLFAFLTVLMALRFYRESVKSKEEIRSEILAGWNSQGKVLVDGDEWNALKNERVIVRSFVRDNKSGGKAFSNYRKGMVAANEGKPIYKDIHSDKVVKE